MSQDEYHPRCVFCAMDAARVLAENDLGYAIRDIRLVTPLHTLVLPKRHAPTFFDLSGAEAQAIERLIRQLRDEIVAAGRDGPRR